MNRRIETLTAWIKESSNSVFFGGAGTSAESGLPTFRGTGSGRRDPGGEVWTNDPLSTENGHLVQTFEQIKKARILTP